MKLKLFTALLTAATLLAPLSLVAGQAQDAGAKRSAIEKYGRLPLSFEATETAARFLARSGNYTVSVGARESSVLVTDAKSGKHQMLRFAFENSNPAIRLEALEPQPGVTNYYLGQDSSQWRLGVKSYARLRAQSVYPGVDVMYYGDHRQLEFDFVIAPKADPAAIALSFVGMDKFYKDASGDLVAEVGGKSVRFAKPYAYQRVGGVAKPVDADYELASNGRVHLQVGNYDNNSELIVDPVVYYATYLGGSAGDVGNGIAVDKTGAAYVTGQTCSSTNFPAGPVPSPNPSGLPFQGACDAFVTKYNPLGTGYDYTTIIGGLIPSNATAAGYGIAVDASNQPYMVGTTNIEDLPPTPGSVLPIIPNSYNGGDSDAFIVILNADGTLQRRSYLGGSSADAGYGIAVDQATPPNVIIVGQTCSDDFPRYNAFETKIEACVAFLTKLDNSLSIPPPISSTASALSPAHAWFEPTFFSEFYGGQTVPPYPTATWQPNSPFTIFAIVLDTLDPPHVQLAVQATPPGDSGSAPVWNTTKGGLTYDGNIVWENLGTPAVPVTAFTEAYGVALDPPGDVFVAGGTNTSSLAPWSSYVGSGAWVLKVNGQTGAFVYGTALETNPTDLTSKIDAARAIAVDSEGRAYVTGTATGSLLITDNAYQSKVAGGQDAFLLRMNTAGSAIDYATYLGGTGNDQGLGVAVDGNFSAYVTGGTQSLNFPAINPLSNPNTTADLPLSGSEGAFISKFTADGAGLIFSTYMGGSEADQGNAIAVAPNSDLDPNDITNFNMYVAGTTTSNDFVSSLVLNVPTAATPYVAPQPAYAGNGDAFLAMVQGSNLPSVTVTPGSLAFPDQSVGVGSSPEAVQYTIQGSATVTIRSITFSSEFAQAFKGNTGGNSADCTPGPIGQSVEPPSTGCTIWVTFTPTAQTQQLGTLTIQDTASSAPHVVNLSGQGAVPIEVYSPAKLTFPLPPLTNQAVGVQSAPQTITLKNNSSSGGTLIISSIALTGANPGDFQESDNCLPQVLASGNCLIDVTFTPAAAGQRTANLVITDSAPGSPHTINLAGTADLVLSSISPASLLLSFPTQATNVLSAPQTVTIANADPTQTLIFYGVPSVTGNYQITGDTCSSSMPAATPNPTCTITVQFDPTQTGTQTGTLTITGNGKTASSNWPAVVNLTGTAGATSTLTFVNPTLSANVGETGTQQWILSNQSPFPLNVYGVALSGPAAASFSQTNNCGTSLQAGSASTPTTCTITVSFTPSATGNFNATLTVTTDSATALLPKTLLGVGTLPSVTVASSLSFTQQLDVPSNPSMVTVTNSSTGAFAGPLNIPSGGISFTGAAAADYSQTNNCAQVAIGRSCAINVVFTPSALGSRNAILVINDDASPSTQSVVLSGTAVPVNTTVNPQTVTFATNQQVNQTSTFLPVTVSNKDSVPLTLGTPAITGDFQISAANTTCGASVAAGGSCVIAITFTPTATGPRTGTLTVNGAGTGMPLGVALSGTGGANSAVSNPANFTANIGESSATQTLVYSNASAFNFNIQSIALGGAAAADFIETDTCGTSLQASSSCNVYLTFKPSATGNRNAALTITSGAAQSPQSVPLLGVGTAPAVVLAVGGNSPATSYTFANQPLNSASAQTVVTLFNNGSGPLNIPAAGITIIGTAASDFTQTNTCGTQVAALVGNTPGSCFIYLVFTPTALYTRSATLNIADDANPSPQSIALTGTGVQVRAPFLNPTTLTFANQPLSQTSSAQNVSILNQDSTYPLTLGTPAFAGDFQSSAAATTCTTLLAAGKSCVIAVTFTPTASGSRTGTLTIPTNASAIPLTVQLSGTGGASGSVSPTSLNLGSVNLAESSAAKSVTVSNSSNFPVNITGINMSGAAAAEFVATNNCGTVVPPLSTCTVSVTFKPTATGSQTATMTIGSDAATPFAPVALTGTGTAPVVSLSTLSLAFANQALNVASTPLPITLNNTGTGPLNFSSIAITGAALGDFKETDNCGLQVVSGGSCVLNVTFTPTALNSRIASLVFTDDAANSPQTVALGGSGVAGSGTIAFSPAVVAFGNQQVSTTSSAQTVTLTNSSAISALTINRVAITNNTDFAIAAGNCPVSPATLAANSSCSISVTFTPSALIAESATLTVTGSASNSPQQVTLTGTGTSSTTGSTPFTITPSSTGVTITQDGTAQYPLSVAPVNGFNDSIKFTCAGPVGSSCSITPNPLTMDGTTTKTATLFVNTTGGNGTTANARFAKPVFLALLPFSIAGILLIGKRRSYWLAFALVGLCLLLGMAGCGAGTGSCSSGGLAPGTYKVIVTATPSANSSQTQTMTMDLVVTKQ